MYVSNLLYLIWFYLSKYHSFTLPSLYYICNFQSNYFQNASILHISFQAQLVWNFKLFVQQVWNIKSNFAVLRNIEYELDFFKLYVLWTNAQLVWNLNFFLKHLFCFDFKPIFIVIFPGVYHFFCSPRIIVEYRDLHVTSLMLATDYGHTVAKSLILCGPNSNPNPN